MSDELKEFVAEQNTLVEAGLVGPEVDMESIEKALEAAEVEAQKVRDETIRERNCYLVGEQRKLCFSIEMMIRAFEHQTSRKVRDVDLYRTSKPLESRYSFEADATAAPGLGNRLDYVVITLEKEEN